MKGRMWRWMCVAGTLLAGTFSFAQTDNLPKETVPGHAYRDAIGVRAGMTSGLTYKHYFTATHNAVEGIIGIWPDAFGLTALYEHNALTEIDGLYWYYGGGAHVNFGNSRSFFTYERGKRVLYRYNDSDFAVGIDGIVGLEYKVRRIPFAFSFDLKPFAEFDNSGDGYFFLDPALGIKVTF